MKFLPVFKTVGLVLLTLDTNVMASPPAGYSVANILPKDLAPRATPIAAYRPDAINNVLLLASELLGVQIVGAATSIEQLDALCAQSKTANGVSRLRASGYNIPILTKVICAGAAAPALPSLDLIRELVAEVSTQIWIVQAIGAVTGPQGVQNLCNWINVEAANAIGLVGDLVKKDVCAAATTVARVRNTNMPASLALKSPIVDPLAPLKEIVLNFVPVASSEE